MNLLQSLAIGTRDTRLLRNYWQRAEGSIPLRTVPQFGRVPGLKTYNNGSLDLGMAKMTSPLVTRGKLPPFKLPDPSELTEIIPDGGRLGTVPVVICVEVY